LALQGSLAQHGDPRTGWNPNKEPEMTKSRDSKKADKKEPSKTPKEKKAAKREKKETRQRG